MAQWAVMVMLWDQGPGGYPLAPDERAAGRALVKKGYVETLASGWHRLTEEGKRVYLNCGRISG